MLNSCWIWNQENNCQTLHLPRTKSTLLEHGVNHFWCIPLSELNFDTNTQSEVSLYLLPWHETNRNPIFNQYYFHKYAESVHIMCVLFKLFICSVSVILWIYMSVAQKLMLQRSFFTFKTLKQWITWNPNMAESYSVVSSPLEAVPVLENTESRQASGEHLKWMIRVLKKDGFNLIMLLITLTLIMYLAHKLQNRWKVHPAAVVMLQPLAVVVLLLILSY